MNSSLLPFGEQRSKAYVATRDAHYQIEVKEPHTTNDNSLRYNFNISELLPGSIEAIIDNQETSAPAGTPSYAMAA